MDAIARFTISHVRFTVLVIAASVLAGTSVYFSQPRQEDPEITLRTAQVVTIAPGLSPERVEQLITEPIEAAIKQIPEIESIESKSSTGMSIVAPEAAARYMDMAPIWSELRNKIDDIRSTLPDAVQSVRVNDDYGRVSVVTLALVGDGYSMAELAEVAEDIQDRLGSLPLVSRVDLFGAQPERIWIEFDGDYLSQFQLSPSAITETLRSQNIVLPGGTINAAGQLVVVEPSGDFRSVEDIRNVAIATDDEGGILYLRDIAKLRRGYVDPPTSLAYWNNQPSIVLGVSMVENSNVVELGEQVIEELEMIRRVLPLGMTLDVAVFQPDLVEESVNSASSNLGQTMLVVLVVVMLFLGWRMGLIVGAMVPLTMFITLILMSVGDVALHRISIAAIIVALGLLVDNGVVVAEDIQQRLENGADRLTAAFGSPRELGIPLLTSSLTTILAFMPLMLAEDTSGEFLRSLGQVLTIALLTSWFLSISLTPALCYWFLPDVKQTGAPREEAAKEVYSGGAYGAYAFFLQVILRHRLLFMLAIFGLFIAATEVFAFVKQRSLGPSERNQFTTYLDLPAQADVSETIAATKRLVHYLRTPEENPEVESVLSYVGGGGPRFFLALAPNDPQPNKAFLVVTTKEPEDIATVMARTERFIVTGIPEGNGRADLLFLGPAALGTVELRVTGDDIETLRHLGKKLTEAFYGVPGTTSIRNDWENAVLKLLVEIDQERARRAGLSSEEIAQALSTVFDGATITNYRERDQVLPVSIRAQQNQRSNLDRLRSVEVYSQLRRGPVPLMQVASVRGEVQPSKILRVDRRRALTIAGKHPDMTAVELLAAMQPAIDAIDVPPGYAISVEGEIRGSKDSNGALFAYAPLALFLMLILLVLQFDSFRRPALILLTIPLVLIGANFGLAVFRAYFDFTAMLGLFSLAGIIINNGIVMIDRIDIARGRGLAVDAAIIDAALARARPIIMTTITTVVGLVPMAMFGGEFWYGMAIVIMSGLAVGTLLTLGFVPVLYSLMFRSFARARA